VFADESAVTALRERIADAIDLGLRRGPAWVRRTRYAQRFLGDLALRERYATGRRFTKAIEAWMAPNLGHPMHQTWLDYALGTNLRGAEAVRRLAALKPVAGARALDVGCAYGGVSVAFAAAGGEAVGIDLDENLLGFAARNVADRRARVTLAQVDVTDRARVRALGRFDFVTCSDVIEHVADVPATVASLAGALAPGGLLHLQVPNGEAAALVLADGHFGAFAITLLERDAALRYFAEKRFGGAYDVHSYLPLDAYLAMLAEHGVRPRGAALQNVPHDLEGARVRVARLVDDVARRREEALGDGALSPETRRALDESVVRYLTEIRGALATVDRAVRDERDALLAAFVRRFAIECWDVIAFKDA
jgi:2-polyprenyl-3-methyl-5-hydroxy-6-metoxy-1,4-benzoquinol methylase